MELSDFVHEVLFIFNYYLVSGYFLGINGSLTQKIRNLKKYKKDLLD